MRNRGRTRRCGRRWAAAGVGGLAPAPDGHDILTITDPGTGDVLVETAAAHGLAGGETVALAGTSVAGYNGASGTTAVDTATRFVLIGVSYTADATGGTWSIA